MADFTGDSISVLITRARLNKENNTGNTGYKGTLKGRFEPGIFLRKIITPKAPHP